MWRALISAESTSHIILVTLNTLLYNILHRGLMAKKLWYILLLYLSRTPTRRCTCGIIIIIQSRQLSTIQSIDVESRLRSEKYNNNVKINKMPLNQYKWTMRDRY